MPVFFLGTLHARKHPFSKSFDNFTGLSDTKSFRYKFIQWWHWRFTQSVFLFCSRANYIRGERNFCANFTGWSVRLETALYGNDLFPFFRLPYFCVLGRDVRSSKIFVDTVPMPGLITMTLVQWAQLWLSVYQQTDARTRDKTVETFTFQDAYDYEYQVFLILSGVRAWASVILAGKRGSRRHSTTSFRANVVVAKTRYQMSEVLSFCDRESA